MNYDKDFVLNKQKNVAIYIKNKRYVMTVNRKPITIEPEVERFLVNYDLMTSLLTYGISEKKMLFERIISYPDEGWDKKFLERFIQLHPRMSPNIWLETDEYKPQAKNGKYTFLVFTLKNCYTWHVTTREEKKLVNMLKCNEQTPDEIQADVVDYFKALFPERLKELEIEEEDDKGYDEYNLYKKLTFRRVAYSFLTSKGFPIEHEPIPQKTLQSTSLKSKRSWWDRLLGWTIIGGVGTLTIPIAFLLLLVIGALLVMMACGVILLICYVYSLFFHIIS